jgi:hypothetical protein
VVEGHRRGGELLFVEGQGSLAHPAYSGVTLGLIHGSAPHVFVLCHKAGAVEVEGYPGYPLPSLPELVELHERIALPCGPPGSPAWREHRRARRAGARAAIAERRRDRAPADDPVRFGAGRLLDAVLAGLRSSSHVPKNVEPVKAGRSEEDESDEDEGTAAVRVRLAGVPSRERASGARVGVTEDAGKTGDGGARSSRRSTTSA